MKRIIYVLGFISCLSTVISSEMKTFSHLVQFRNVINNESLRERTTNFMSQDLIAMKYETMYEIKQYKQDDLVDAYYHIALFFLFKDRGLTEKKYKYAVQMLMISSHMNHPKALILTGFFVLNELDLFQEAYPMEINPDPGFYFKKAAQEGDAFGEFLYGCWLFSKIPEAKWLIKYPSHMWYLDKDDLFLLKKAMKWIKKSHFVEVASTLSGEDTLEYYEEEDTEFFNEDEIC